MLTATEALWLRHFEAAITTFWDTKTGDAQFVLGSIKSETFQFGGDDRIRYDIAKQFCPTFQIP